MLTWENPSHGEIYYFFFLLALKTVSVLYASQSFEDIFGKKFRTLLEVNFLFYSLVTSISEN